MAITRDDFSGSFEHGLAQGGVESTGTAQDGPSELNTKITAAVMDPGVPVDNAPR
ncbi:hypothetical protein [Mycobacterium scrofulaceum]|uniref:hypothetical protein n=1 Tax=Mycobacterium scrofulaceum TaxID=1783 RepID=UPI001301F59D|nr:hypothetical protein [Mycobacterium scrofulaceum]